MARKAFLCWPKWHQKHWPTCPSSILKSISWYCSHLFPTVSSRHICSISLSLRCCQFGRMLMSNQIWAFCVVAMSIQTVGDRASRAGPCKLNYISNGTVSKWPHVASELAHKINIWITWYEIPIWITFRLSQQSPQICLTADNIT